jgi:hypothetical protein
MTSRAAVGVEYMLGNKTEKLLKVQLNVVPTEECSQSYPKKRKLKKQAFQSNAKPFEKDHDLHGTRTRDLWITPFRSILRATFSLIWKIS